MDNQKIINTLKQNIEIIEGLSKQVVEQKEVIKEQKEVIVEQKEVNKTMIKAFDTDGLSTMFQVSKTLGYKGFSRNRIYGLLRLYGILSNYKPNWNLPYQQYVDQGLFKLVQVPTIDKYDTLRIHPTTYVYQRGVDFIRRLIDEYIEEQNKSNK